MEKVELDKSYLSTLFLRISTLSINNREEGKIIMQEIDTKLKDFPNEALLWCLRGLSQKKYWELDYQHWLEDRVKHPESTLAFYRRKLQKDYTDCNPVVYYLKKAAELEPDNSEFKKLVEDSTNN